MDNKIKAIFAVFLIAMMAFALTGCEKTYTEKEVNAQVSAVESTSNAKIESVTEAARQLASEKQAAEEKLAQVSAEVQATSAELEKVKAENAKLQEAPVIVPTSGAGNSAEDKSYLVEDVNLAGNFAKTIDSDKLSTLSDFSVDYKDESYDVSEYVVLSSDLKPKLNVEDFGSDVAIEAASKGAVEYKLEFDSPINVTPDEELVLNFLGKEITLINHGTNSIVMRTSQKYTLGLNQKLVIGKTNIEAVGFGDTDNPKVLLTIDGKSYQLSEGDSKTVNGMKVKVDSIFVSTIGAGYQSVDIYVGKDLTDTVVSGDEYLADKLYDWKIVSTSTGITSIGVVLADKYTDKDEVFKLGDSIVLPNAYKTVKFDSLRNLDVTNMQVDVSSDEIRIKFDGRLEIKGKKIDPAVLTVVNESGGYVVKYSYKDEDETATLADVSFKIGDRNLGLNYAAGNLAIGTYTYGYVFGVDRITSGPAILSDEEDRRDVSGDIFYRTDIVDASKDVDSFEIGLVDAEAKEVIVKVY